MQRKDTFSQSGKRIGRPRVVLDHTIEAFFDRIEAGRVVKHVCADPDMPSQEWVYSTVKTDKVFAERLLRARQLCAHGLAEQVVTIADEATPETVQVARQRCESRRWLAGRWNAAYADKPTEVNVSLSWERLIEQSMKTVEPPAIEHDDSSK